MEKFAEQLNGIIEQNISLLNEITDQEFSYKISTEKWSKKEILGHLIDSAENNIQRFVRVQYENEPFIFYEQDEWVRIQDYQNKYSKEEIITLWRLLNKQIITILQNLPVEKQALKCYKNKELVSITFVIEDYIKHLLHHLEQIINS